jgi:hypothetical protein
MTTLMFPVGWYEKAADSLPTHDPGLFVPCPVCGDILTTGPRTTISLCAVGGTTSYFFRAHRNCWSASSEEIRQAIESRIIDGLSADDSTPRERT